MTQFKPGQSGNPSGRPKSLFASSLREATKDGQELAEFYLALFRDAKKSLKTRMAAADWIADRGFGKPVQSTELSGPDGEAIPLKSYHVVSPDDWPQPTR